MKFGTEPSDFIDDEDIRFLENLSLLNRTYVDNLEKKLKLDVSLIPPKFLNLYEKISDHYSLVKTSEKKSELYHNFDLRYEGEEFHIRNIREQIIHYLDNKKHQIFTNHRVEFFINIALNTKFENLRDNCREMTFDERSKKRISLDEKTSGKSKTNSKSEKKIADDHNQSINCINEMIDLFSANNDAEESVIKDEILNNFSKMDTLLFPYIKMIHPETDLDYEAAHKFITDILNGNDDFGGEMSDENNMVVAGGEESLGGVAMSEDSDEVQAVDTAVQVKAEVVVDQAEQERPAMVEAEQAHVYMPKLVEYRSARPFDGDETRRSIPPLHASMDVIEISDEEDESAPPLPAVTDTLKLLQNHGDVDQMIDYLIHRCHVPADRHPSLLKDHQLQVELNAFLLLVNFSIRLSLRYALEQRDRHIFLCIFLASIVVGLTCLVSITERGVVIDQLSDAAYRIVQLRLDSLQIDATDVRRVGASFSVLVNPDIARLTQLGLYYVRSYQDTGELCDK